jgi:uncharacterized protein YecE (DUF72 family)
VILVGTSGYSYSDWVGPYYPEGTRKGDFLSFYAGEFQTTELNFSFYRMPAARTMAQIAAKVPDGFVFAVKATRTITHEREGDLAGQASEFVSALKPLREQGKFGCVLAQFPHSFHANDENRAYLLRLREAFGETPLVVEFRGRDWITDETFDMLEELWVGFCCVDQPRLRGLIPPIARATGPVSYVRFHGRNAQKWWQHDEAWERYDYTYTPEELAEWTPKLRALDEEAPLTLVYTNNHWRGQAVDTARQLRLMLGQAQSG